MRHIIESIAGEYRRYKLIAERAADQVSDDELFLPEPSDENSVAALMTHLGGNLKSRFTDFLNSDGEKPWRDRDSEFQPRRDVSRAQLLEQWDSGWSTLLAALGPLADDDLSRVVTIR